MNVAIILAGGTGTRIGAGIPKQFTRVLGKPILAYTLEIYQNNPNIDAIEIVYHKDWLTEIKTLVAEYHITKVKWYAVGGKTFQESSMNGVFNLKGKLMPEDIVVQTFGVSPMTTDELIDDSIRVCKQYGNGIASDDIPLCTCIKDPKDNNNSSVEPIIRETIKGFANPWTFKYGELCEAYETGLERGLLDTLEPHTTSLYLALGKRLHFSKGNNMICKITYKQDLDIFLGWLLASKYHAGKLEIKE